MRKNSKKRLLSLIVLLFTVCFLGVGTSTVTASAETTHTIEEVADGIVFITFKKGTSEERGNYVGASFFFPNESYEAEYEYGVAVFPEKFIARYELYGDYIARKEADGISIALIIGNGGVVENGRLMSYNIINIPETGLDMRLVFVFFVRNTDGEVAYKEPVISSFNEATLENPTVEKLVTLAGERQKEIAVNSQFAIIVNKLSELVDSVWIYLVIGASAIVIAWGAYIGIRIAIAKKNEEKINAKGMIIRLLIGIVIAFILAVGAPLLIKGLGAWAI